MNSQVTNWCASLSSKLRRRTVISAATPLSEADKDLILDALVMRTALLYDLLTLAGSSHTTYVVDCWKRTILGLETLDVELYASDWKKAREIVTSEEFLGLYPDAPACSRSFKQTAAKHIHYQWIVNACIALIEDGGDGWYSYVNQFIVFDSKLNLTSLDLTEQCCRDYLDFEASTHTREEWRRIQYDTTDDSESARSKRRIIRLLRVVAEEMFGDFDITSYPFRPRHGNGATREVQRSTADSWHKNRQFLVDSEIIHYLRYRSPDTDWHDWFYEPRRGLERTSELVCVPKSMTSNRTISKEPTTLQFLQQDVFRALDDYFKEKLSAHIDLHDQERSRRFAKAGSSDGSYATIDLSSASDSVTVAHIDYLFEGLPIWYPLVATRSDRVHVRSSRGEVDCVIETSKFAPMGSATCFPTECAVFAIVAECAIRVTTGRRSRDDDYVIYGDDIVIRDDCFHTACAILHLLGFTVNRDKSFGGETSLGLTSGAFFREACGIECLNGEDITPLRLSRRLVSLTNNDSDRLAGQGVGMVDLLNRTYVYGYTELRRWINSVLVAHKWYRTLVRISWSDYETFVSRVADRLPTWVRVAMPFVITDDLSDTQWRCFGTRNGWNIPRPACQLQRREANVTVVKSRQPRTPLVATATSRAQWGIPHDSNDYYTWALAQVSQTVAEDEVVIDDTGIVTIRAKDLKWSQMWVPLN